MDPVEQPDEMQKTLEESLELLRERELQTLRDAGIIKQETPTLSRSTFDGLAPAERAAFVRSGGQIVNDPPRAQAPLGKNQIRRATFDELPHPDRMAFVKNGGQVID